MAIQYSGGTIVNTTFATTTRADLVNNITSNLSTAGWTTISSATGDITMETVAYNNAKVRFRFFDPGSGNCAQVTMKHSSGSPTSNICYLLPGNSYRIIANKYQFFCFAVGSSNKANAREVCMGGNVWFPSFLTIASGDAVAWMQYHGTGDADVTSKTWSFRSRLKNASNSSNPFSTIYGAANVQSTATSGLLGQVSCVVSQGGDNITTDGNFRWYDGSYQVTEALIGWSAASTSSESKIKGQIWDAIIVSGSWAGESSITYDGHTFMCITDNPTTVSGCLASLFVAVT
jgi:hypothetical protein